MAIDVEKKSDLRFYQGGILDEFIHNVNLKQLDKNAMELTKEVEVTWNDLTEFARYVKQVFEKGNYSSICGIPRAGLLLALYISMLYEIPLTITPGKRTLVLDDDTISGLSILSYMNKSDVIVYGIYPDAPVKPRYIFRQFGRHERIKYPWNRPEIKE